MKVYSCRGFKGHYPVGSAALVVAETDEQAVGLLTAELNRAGLPQDRPVELHEVPMDKPAVVILVDGNY